jgi:hypothetical protein
MGILKAITFQLQGVPSEMKAITFQLQGVPSEMSIMIWLYFDENSICR